MKKGVDSRCKAVDTGRMSKYITMEQAQEILGASHATVSKMIERGDISTMLWGRYPRLKLSDVMKLKRQRG